MRCDVRKYGDPVLKAKATPVKKVDDSIRRLVKDMLDSMYASNGVGLAAEQIGRTEMVCVIDVPPARAEENQKPEDQNPGVKMPIVMINPAVEELIGEQVGDEGCLSFPQIYVKIRRAQEVAVAFTDVEGRKQKGRYRGLVARAVQHELDHLNGILLVDRMSAVQKVAMSGRLRRLKKESAELLAELA